MLSSLPVTRSAVVRNLFFVCASLTTLIMLWANHIGSNRASVDLTQIFLYLFGHYDYLGASGALLILVGATAIRSLPSRRLLRWIGEHPLQISIGCIALLCVAALVIYRNHPLSMDEYTAYFQSQVFAAGHLAGRLPVEQLDWLIPKRFQDYFLFVSPHTGEVASGYWPMFSLLLMPFTALHIPWACNPVISGLTLIVIHRLARAIYDDVEIAGAAVLFAMASPVFFADGISYYAMQAHLLANSVYALLLLRPTARRALLAGIVGSMALTLHNPVPHLLFAVPWLLWVARQPAGARLIGCLAAGYAPLCLLLGVGWVRFYTGLAHGVTAAAVVSPEAMDSVSRFASAFALPSGAILLARAIGVAKLWLWAVPGLVVLAVIGAWHWRTNTACRLLLASALITLIGYLIVPADQGHGWGYRYFHSAWMVLPLLAAGALARPAVSEDFRTFVVACALLSLVFGIGQRALQMHEFIAEDLRHLPVHECPQRCVMFLNPYGGFYELDLVQNDPWLRGNDIRMVSAGSKANAAVMSAWYPQMQLVAKGPYGEAWSTP